MQHFNFMDCALAGSLEYLGIPELYLSDQVLMTQTSTDFASNMQNLTGRSKLLNKVADEGLIEALRISSVLSVQPEFQAKLKALNTVVTAAINSDFFSNFKQADQLKKVVEITARIEQSLLASLTKEVNSVVSLSQSLVTMSKARASFIATATIASDEKA